VREWRLRENYRHGAALKVCVCVFALFSSGQDSVQKTVRSCLFSTGGLPSAVSCGGRRG